METKNKNLVSIKKACEMTGSSYSFFKRLVRAKKLTKFKVNKCTYISMTEFEKLAEPHNSMGMHT